MTYNARRDLIYFMMLFLGNMFKWTGNIPYFHVQVGTIVKFPSNATFTELSSPIGRTQDERGCFCPELDVTPACAVRALARRSPSLRPMVARWL